MQLVMTNWDSNHSLQVSLEVVTGAVLPGSRGHSFSFANSDGVFPVSTQLELRSIIGILSKIEYYLNYKYECAQMMYLLQVNFIL